MATNRVIIKAVDLVLVNEILEEILHHSNEDILTQTVVTDVVDQFRMIEMRASAAKTPLQKVEIVLDLPLRRPGNV